MEQDKEFLDLNRRLGYALRIKDYENALKLNEILYREIIHRYKLYPGKHSQKLKKTLSSLMVMGLRLKHFILDHPDKPWDDNNEHDKLCYDWKSSLY